MVDLVLEDARLQARRLDPDGLAVDVEADHRRVERALDVHRYPRQAETSLLGDYYLLGDPLDLRVDEPRRLGVSARLEDQHPTQEAELGGCQTNPPAVAHDRDHPLELSAQLGTEVRPRRRLALQHRVAELDHLGESLLAQFEPPVLLLQPLVLAGADRAFLTH